MRIGQDGDVLRGIRTLFTLGATGEMSDGQLLERFLTERGEAAELAFAVLVERHGPMVLRVCRATLADSHDAHDAFQATFLVLIRKARSLWVRDSIGPWLHQVAYRTSSCLRISVARRRRLERRSTESSASDSGPLISDELVRVLHEELGKLPERYRAPVVLCDLESTTHEQAARHLGWPIGTVKSRLIRAREILGDRLRRRGFAPDLGLLTAIPGLRGFESIVPPALVDQTTRAVVHLVTTRTILQGSAAALTREVLGIMSFHRSIKVASFLAAVIATATGVESFAQKKAGPDAGSKIKDEQKAIRVDDLPTSVVRPGKFRGTVVERGRVEATQVVDVMSDVEGSTTIMSILPEGTRVKIGDRVATLDSTSLRDQFKSQQITSLQADANFQNAKFAREVAESALVEYVDGVSKQEQDTLRGTIAVAKSAIEKANARLERTRKARNRMNEAIGVRKESVTPADIVADLDLDDRLEDAELSLMREALSLQTAQTKLDVFQKRTMDRTKRQLTNESDQASTIALIKEATQALERDKLARLERQIKSCILVASKNGVIIYTNNPDGSLKLPRVEVGATVRERQKILSIVDVDGPMRVMAKIREPRVDRVAQGVHARITVDAFAGKTLTGVVEAVAPSPDPGPSLANTPKLYSSRLRIDDRFPGLRPGMTADVEIPIFELDGVLSVPKSAVLRFDGKLHVAVKKPGGGFEWRDVVAGEVNDTDVEIKQGLRSGESVILKPLALMSEEERREKLGAPPPPGR